MGSRNQGKPPITRHYDPYGKRAESRTPGEGRDENRDEGEGIIEGRNAVLEALRANITIDKVFIVKGEVDPALRHIASAARQAGAVIVEADRRKLDSMSITHAHQGVIAMASCAEYVSISDMLESARKKNEAPLIVLCDEISDPHNLGAVIRTCEAAGAHGIVIPKRRSAGLSATVAKASSGAVYHMAVARIPNMSSAIAELKKAGVWIYGASVKGGAPYWQTDFTGPAALVIGAEGAGISRLVNDKCDFHVNIPMYGKIASLNASVSAAILIYEAVKQRRGC